MEVKNKSENYFEFQNSRSGGDMNSNTLFDDLKKFKIEIGKDWNILDIGCRQGLMLKRLFESGYRNVYGIDIGEHAKNRWVKEKYPFITNMVQCDVHRGIPFDIQFDLITISHTLEHLYDPELVISLIFDSLKEDGLVHSIVPIEPKSNFDNYDPHLVRFDSHQDHIDLFENTGFTKCFDYLNDLKVDNHNSILICKKSQSTNFLKTI